MRSSRCGNHKMELMNVQLVDIPREFLDQTIHRGGILNKVFLPHKATEQLKKNTCIRTNAIQVYRERILV